MGRFYSFIVIIMLFSMQSVAYADGPVRLRNDAKVVDIQGNILAVPNPSDPRNNDYEKYYVKVMPGGGLSDTSNFYIVNDPKSGYTRKDLEEGTPPLEQTVANNTQQVAQNTAPQTANYTKTGLVLEYVPSMPIYDYIKGPGTVYGD